MQAFLAQHHITQVKPFASAGLMSTIFTGEQDGKQVIIHHTKPNAEQRYQHVKDKIIFVADLLRKQGLPCTPIIASTTLDDGSFVLVQARLPGTPLGQRTFDGKRFHDTYDHAYVPQILALAATVHQTMLTGFGPLRKGAGTFPTWKAFLEASAERWLATLRSTKPPIIDQAEETQIKQTISSLLERLPDWDQSCLVHGDLTNPGNILVHDGQISGLIDFEWALAGDPAWEFAFTDMPLEHYCKITKTDKQAFLERVRIYRFFWLLWGAAVHANDQFQEAMHMYLREALHARMSTTHQQ